MTNTESNNVKVQATGIETAVARNRAFAAAGGDQGALALEMYLHTLATSTADSARHFR